MTISGEVIAVGICFVITMTYSVAAGMWAVLWTDLVQFVIKMTAVIVLAVFAVRAVGGFSVIAMPTVAPAFAATGRSPGVVRPGGHGGQPGRGEVRPLAQHRHGRVGHGRRAADAGVDLAPDDEAGGPDDVGAGLPAADQGAPARPDVTATSSSRW